MDNKKELPRQEEQTASCTIDEFLKMMEPAFRQKMNVVEKCVAGLAVHAANLAAQGQEDDIPSLECFVAAMAEFWEPETSATRIAVFKQAVSEAHDSGQIPELTEQDKADILAGLELYTQEMRSIDPEMEESAAGCELLADSLQIQWQTAQKQEEQTVSYTIDEFAKIMEPIFQRQKIIVEKYTAGLTVHAANLAAQGQEDDIPGLKSFVTAMAEFWDLETSASRVAGFEQAVSEARNSGQAPELTEQSKADILAGLELYAQEIRCVDPEMEEWAVGCEHLADSLQIQWQTAQKKEMIEGMMMGSIT